MRTTKKFQLITNPVTAHFVPEAYPGGTGGVVKLMAKIWFPTVGNTPLPTDALVKGVPKTYSEKNVSGYFFLKVPLLQPWATGSGVTVWAEIWATPNNSNIKTSRVSMLWGAGLMLMRSVLTRVTPNQSPFDCIGLAFNLSPTAAPKYNDNQGGNWKTTGSRDFIILLRVLECTLTCAQYVPGERIQGTVQVVTTERLKHKGQLRCKLN